MPVRLGHQVSMTAARSQATLRLASSTTGAARVHCLVASAALLCALALQLVCSAALTVQHGRPQPDAHQAPGLHPARRKARAGALAAQLP